MQLSSVTAFGKALVHQVLDDGVMDLAAGLAYRFLFAVFPFAIFLAALASFIAPWLGLGDPTNEIISAIGDNLPPDVASQLAPQLQAVLGEARPGLLSIAAVGALWVATTGISSLITAMNKAYDVDETRNFLRKTGLALLLTLVASAGILVSFATLVGGSILTQQAVQALGVSPGLWNTIALLRFPLVLVLVALAVAALFRFGPNVAVSFRWTAVGGVVFAIGWVVATAIFGIYVANFASYANTYGALGGVVVLMLWFYITALLLLVAAEITSLLATQNEPERLQARRDEVAVDAGDDDRVDDEAGPPIVRPRRVALDATSSTAAAAEVNRTPPAGGPRLAPARPTSPSPTPPRAAAPGDAPRGTPRALARRSAAVAPGRPDVASASSDPLAARWPRRVFAIVVLIVGGIAGAAAAMLAGPRDGPSGRS